MSPSNLCVNEDKLNIFAWLMIVLGVSTFISSFYYNVALYGRYGSTYNGISVNASVAWLLQEAPAFIVPVLLLCMSDDKKEIATLQVSPNVVILSMFLLHYFRRSFIYPFWIKNTAPSPITIFISSFVFCACNGYMQGEYHVHCARYHEEWFYTYQFVLGSLLFFVGFVINTYGDYVVTHLRKPGETGHKIPRGGLFEYISCPNFFGEIVEWGGYALASSSFVAFAFFFNSAIVVGARALYHHSFYYKKFEDYPKNRKALIPFIL
ncbi:3-oxo-5-alpha-steroid 4-dehydrogenase 1-like [Dendronephthya gigantea]|uniref:3-oxo-5-alpha-steroid 4-dehydrogenase 1-like n=1 Tax=Dendronephthya gigantea TaxID=151771 RepID=UPI0010696837|nr:3-oxo-5-alpha-steroid 4-dehydrogenase 1-like [Dendronephthya gigantea]